MTPRERSTAETQLERILHILPVAARAGGASVADLAHDLGVPPRQIIDDLTEATARSFHHPGGTVEPFTILFTRRQVRVEAHEHFRRPARVSEREAVALGLGLRVLAGEATCEARRAEILELATRLEAALPAAGARTVAEPDDGVEYDAEEFGLALGDDRFRGTFAEAIEQRVVCGFTYLKAGDVTPGERRIAPYRLVYASGRWYVAGLDVERDALRFFRLDRVLDAAVSSEAAPEPPARFEEWLAGAPYHAGEEEEVTVVYDRAVAPWVCEAVGVEPEEDGTVIVRHRVADRRWIVRHVLQYGGAARVVKPQAVRDMLVDASARAGAAPAASAGRAAR